MSEKTLSQLDDATMLMSALVIGTASSSALKALPEQLKRFGVTNDDNIIKNYLDSINADYHISLVRLLSLVDSLEQPDQITLSKQFDQLIKTSDEKSGRQRDLIELLAQKFG